MNGALLDTSVLIANDAEGVIELPDTAAISVISLGELRAGVLLARDRNVAAARRRRFEGLRAAFVPLAVDEDVADRYADVLKVARSQKRSVKATDLLIIATAASAGRELFTLDRAQASLALAAGVATTHV